MYQIDRTRSDTNRRELEQSSEKLFIFLKTSTDAISDVFVVLSFPSSSSAAAPSVRYALMVREEGGRRRVF